MDDEEGQVELLERELKAFPVISIIKKYTDPKIFLSEQPDLNFDLAFLDIDMSGLKGTEVSTMFRKPVVFVSAHRKDYSEELFDLINHRNNIIGTVNKATLTHELKSLLPKVMERLSARNGTILLRCLREDRNFEQSKIILIATIPDGQGYKKDMRLLQIKDGKPNEGEWFIIKDTRLKDIMEKLNPELFFQINRSYIVSKSSVESLINSDEVRLRIPANITDIKHLSIGEGLTQAFKDWLGR